MKKNAEDAKSSKTPRRRRLVLRIIAAVVVVLVVLVVTAVLATFLADRLSRSIIPRSSQNLILPIIFNKNKMGMPARHNHSEKRRF